MTFDELLKMTDQQRTEYLRDEVEKIISCAEPQNVLKLRKLQARIDGVRRRIKNPQVALSMIYGEMLDSLRELNNALRS